MARTILEYEYHRNKGVKLTPLPMSFLTGDKNGHEFRISIVDKNGSVDLTGAEVWGWLIPDDQNRTDDITVAMTGSAEGNVASLTLSEGCYLHVGRFSLVIKVSTSEEVATVFWATGSMLRSSTDTLRDDGKVSSLEALLARIENIQKQDRLWGKTLYAVGDSFTYGANNSHTDENGKTVYVSYVTKVATRHNMSLTNKARAGATLVLTDTTNDMACIRKQVGSFIANFPAPDYFILSGGYNDAQYDANTVDHATSPLGAIVPADSQGKNAYTLSVSNFDIGTVCGTVEYLIGQLRKSYPMTKLLYVLTCRVATQYRWGALYAPAIKEICRKWAVPVVDLTQEGNMLVNPDYPQNERIFTDGTHPNDEGYERMADIVEAKLMTI